MKLQSNCFDMNKNFLQHFKFISNTEGRREVKKYGKNGETYFVKEVSNIVMSIAQLIESKVMQHFLGKANAPYDSLATDGKKVYILSKELPLFHNYAKLTYNAENYFLKALNKSHIIPGGKMEKFIYDSCKIPVLVEDFKCNSYSNTSLYKSADSKCYALYNLQNIELGSAILEFLGDYDRHRGNLGLLFKDSEESNSAALVKIDGDSAIAFTKLADQYRNFYNNIVNPPKQFNLQSSFYRDTFRYCSKEDVVKSFDTIANESISTFERITNEVLTELRIYYSASELSKQLINTNINKLEADLINFFKVRLEAMKDIKDCIPTALDAYKWEASDTYFSENYPAYVNQNADKVVNPDKNCVSILNKHSIDVQKITNEASLSSFWGEEKIGIFKNLNLSLATLKKIIDFDKDLGNLAKAAIDGCNKQLLQEVKTYITHDLTFNEYIDGKFIDINIVNYYSGNDCPSDFKEVFDEILPSNQVSNCYEGFCQV
ncbi:hypothetical protein I862_00720 [endosymbiont of Acanthamoeba sp. UWC8]|uniref:hypothetical protein n=1 Tax=endosymbiont of Acanthamoeba sp. UWC8 TaxID=86106 RepID=UPI0004D114B8|nr:hypothetical protein [endosymbiont of Acanthamoeba sp. UWC8]AIF80709.1 hypothetical protein I862_00720 [endosymbiont of Acanthamoeba sp. UWC8]